MRKYTHDADLAGPLFGYPTKPVLSSATSIAIVCGGGGELYDITPDKIRFREHGTGTLPVLLSF